VRLLRHIISTLVLCAIFCVPSHADSPELNNLASDMAGHDVTVQCYPVNDLDPAAGWVEIGYDVIHLDGSLCGSLQNVLNDNPRGLHWAGTLAGSDAVGYAFLAMLHEATHIREWYEQGLEVAKDEGETECAAYRNVWPALSLLGLPWKTRALVYEGAKSFHMSKSPTGDDAEYRSVC
jgi:hypothetical protein